MSAGFPCDLGFPVRHELPGPSEHVMWHETWVPASGSGRRLVGLVCAACGRTVSEPKFLRRDGKDLLIAPSCEEIMVSEVMSS